MPHPEASFQIPQILVNGQQITDKTQGAKTTIKLTSLEADSPFHRMVESLKVNPANCLGGSHETKVHAEIAAKCLLIWAEHGQRDILEMGVHFIEDMAALIEHKKGTNPTEAAALTQLTREVVDAIIARADDIYPETINEEGQDSDISLALSKIGKTLDAAVKNGFATMPNAQSHPQHHTSRRQNVADRRV